MIVGLFPELSASGGVQRAGRLTAAVLASFGDRRREPNAFLSLNDPVGMSRLQIGSQEIAFKGFGRSKAHFLLVALRAAVRQPSLIVALHPNLAPVVVAMKGLAPRARAVIFVHGIEVWAPLGRMRRWALRRSDLVLGPSDDTIRQAVLQQGIAGTRARKLPWSLGPEFNPHASPCTVRLNGFPSGRIILSVGRWDVREAYKGLDHLILALPAVLDAVPETHLVAIGDGSDLPRLEGLARESGVAERVHFLHGMPPEELWAAYDLCDIFALPSRGEGFGLVFLEAMAHAKPVIGGGHGGTLEIIEDGVTGYLVQHGDVAKLAEVLKALLMDEPSRRRMGAKALERVCQDFTFERFSREFTTLLETFSPSNGMT